MEAALNDFESWIATMQPTTVEYYAIFDPTNGKITGIYPDHAAKDIVNKLLIDADIAESVFEGKTTLHSYVVDLTSASVEFVEIQSLTTIDDILYSIPHKKYFDETNNDIFVTYDKIKSIITIELAKKHNGTRELPGILAKKLHWVDTTKMTFFLTEYNNPNYLYYSIELVLEELVEKKKVIDNIVLPKKFSVYTRRLFKNYIVEEI